MRRLTGALGPTGRGSSCAARVVLNSAEIGAVDVSAIAAENDEVAQIELRDVSKHFGRVRALDGVSLAVRRGSIHALIGENGAGQVDSRQDHRRRLHGRRWRDAARRSARLVSFSS